MLSASAYNTHKLIYDAGAIYSNSRDIIDSYNNDIYIYIYLVKYTVTINYTSFLNRGAICKTPLKLKGCEGFAI